MEDTVTAWGYPTKIWVPISAVFRIYWWVWDGIPFRLFTSRRKNFRSMGWNESFKPDCQCIQNIYTTLHCTALHWTALHYTTHYTLYTIHYTLHYRHTHTHTLAQNSISNCWSGMYPAWKSKQVTWLKRTGLQHWVLNVGLCGSKSDCENRTGTEIGKNRHAGSGLSRMPHSEENCRNGFEKAGMQSWSGPVSHTIR